ncbi:hypothetical protein VTL71DRAFT_3432 [Oculimacula yallundae]|uniref:Uncharacterized protein n=1 Tax=Oculimacula yallundae TaxID=86028 RepID=A0ABR4C8A7_9HELO
MTLPQGANREQQPEIIRPIKGPVITDPRRYWYCCNERGIFHGIIGRETFGRNTGSFCAYCDHSRCSKCKTREDFIMFWRCCNTSVCHDALPDDVIMHSSSFFSQYWIVNDLAYGGCRLCGHERCDTCRFERYPDLKSHFNTMTIDHQLRRGTPVAIRDVTAVGEDEWNTIVTWTEAMDYQKAQKRRQAEIEIALKYLAEAEKEEMQEEVEEIESSIVGSNVSNEVQEKMAEIESSAGKAKVPAKLQGKVEEVDPLVVQSNNFDNIHVHKKETDIVAKKDENTPLKQLRDESIAELIAASPGPRHASER